MKDVSPFGSPCALLLELRCHQATTLQSASLLSATAAKLQANKAQPKLHIGNIQAWENLSLGTDSKKGLFSDRPKLID